MRPVAEGRRTLTIATEPRRPHAVARAWPWGNSGGAVAHQTSGRSRGSNGRRPSHLLWTRIARRMMWRGGAPGSLGGAPPAKRPATQVADAGFDRPAEGHTAAD